MFLSQLFEAVDKRHASFAFGRMNPPTVGHGQLIDTVAQAAAGGDYFVFTSQTQDSKKNPLDYATKVKFIKAMFPQHAGHVVYNPELKTIMQVANWLYSKGYRSVTFVAGSDRLASFKELLTKYNGQEDGYNFDSINFVSSGDRDPDADGIAGVSASSAREAASQGNFEAFAQATGAGKLAKPLYDAVRKGMLLGEGSGEMTAGELRNMYNYYVNVKGMSPEEAERLVYTRDEPLDEHIVKHGSGYRLVSKKTGKNLGDFPTKAAAKKHEREVQYFKHIGEGTSNNMSTEDMLAYLRQHHDPNLHQDYVNHINTFSNFVLKDIPVSSIKTDLAGLDKSKVEQYKQMDFSKAPPIVMGDGYILDGYHRATVAKALGIPTIKGYVGVKGQAVAECSGYIPKNKKEAKDPRWSNALTVDVHPDTPNKNLKAFKLA